MNRYLPLIAPAALLVSCGEQKSDAPARTEPPAEATADMQPTPPAATAAGGEIADGQARLTLATLAAPYNNADLVNGRTKFASCRACHTLTEGGAKMTGPNLWGLFGRQIGSKEGYTYSKAAQNADFIWDTAKLEQWLDNPKEFLPGNKMVFNGIHDVEDRRDVIAYLATQTQAPPAS